MISDEAVDAAAKAIANNDPNEVVPWEDLDDMGRGDCRAAARDALTSALPIELEELAAQETGEAVSAGDYAKQLGSERDYEGANYNNGFAMGLESSARRLRQRAAALRTGF